ncbi:hypothetical protein [Salinisphaera orenii]|uniref:Uncharacterized protein n=1 Tax=Salinisphaera orenii YIM 95161 TaxID=1051139 RepID=A0A423PU99_9GAMM|nr:hypothetical protein [Salinisphaera halophila]ROO29163.1 hypothetical protein SAHL_09390 [Salinisphaera halophila YIM 95161]
MTDVAHNAFVSRLRARGVDPMLRAGLTIHSVEPVPVAVHRHDIGVVRVTREALCCAGDPDPALPRLEIVPEAQLPARIEIHRRRVGMALDAALTDHRATIAEHGHLPWAALTARIGHTVMSTVACPDCAGTTSDPDTADPGADRCTVCRGTGRYSRGARLQAVLACAERTQDIYCGDHETLVGPAVERELSDGDRFVFTAIELLQPGRWRLESTYRPEHIHIIDVTFDDRRMRLVSNEADDALLTGAELVDEIATATARVEIERIETMLDRMERRRRFVHPRRILADVNASATGRGITGARLARDGLTPWPEAHAAPARVDGLRTRLAALIRRQRRRHGQRLATGLFSGVLLLGGMLVAGLVLTAPAQAATLPPWFGGPWPEAGRRLLAGLGAHWPITAAVFFLSIAAIELCATALEHRSSRRTARRHTCSGPVAEALSCYTASRASLAAALILALLALSLPHWAPAALGDMLPSSPTIFSAAGATGVG